MEEGKTLEERNFIQLSEELFPKLAAIYPLDTYLSLENLSQLDFAHRNLLKELGLIEEGDKDLLAEKAQPSEGGFKITITSPSVEFPSKAPEKFLSFLKEFQLEDKVPERWFKITFRGSWLLEPQEGEVLVIRGGEIVNRAQGATSLREGDLLFLGRFNLDEKEHGFICFKISLTPIYF